MTQKLQKAFELASALPGQRQDELGNMLINLVEQEKSPLKLSKAHIAEVEARLAAPPDFASDAGVEAFFKRLTGLNQNSE
jgi:hypothetical protein